MAIREDRLRAAARRLELIRTDWSMPLPRWTALPEPLSALDSALAADDPAAFDRALGWLTNRGPVLLEGDLPAAAAEAGATEEVLAVLVPLLDRLTERIPGPPPGPAPAPAR